VAAVQQSDGASTMAVNGDEYAMIVDFESMDQRNTGTGNVRAVHLVGVAAPTPEPELELEPAPKQPAAALSANAQLLKEAREQNLELGEKEK